MNSNTDEKYMRRCLQLAANGRFGAPPNPMVGAVVVCDGRIIGEGYHMHCGGPHAEVNAIASVKDQSLLPRSTVYVSLEPCAHYGKTPPCADMLVSKHVKRVVVGCADPFAAVSGRGIARLRDAGIEVTVGVLEQECRMLNCRFITYHSRKRPYVILKWAQSADGYIAPGGEARRAFISTPMTQMCSHRLRTENDAILVGRHTAECDNPSLTARAWHGKNPLRIVLDRNATLPATLNLFDGNAATLAVTAHPYPDGRPATEYLHPDYGRDIIPQLMDALHARGIQSLVVEGGRMVLQSFMDRDVWDEIVIEQGSCLFGGGTEAPQAAQGRNAAALVRTAQQGAQPKKERNASAPAAKDGAAQPKPNNQKNRRGYRGYHGKPRPKTGTPGDKTQS